MSISNSLDNSGRRFSFFKLFSNENIQVEVPIIQRDYAQGRPSKKEVRNLFLDALYQYLDENKPNRDLDFIYGTIENGTDRLNKFIPLDGQQRLTTLFLLHWYLALKENKIDHFRSYLVNDNKSRFTYKTRFSSTDFCDKLVNCDFDLESLLSPDYKKQNEVSKSIINQSWYFLIWNNDPTIQSMLIMLDAIHQKFKSSSDFYDRLVNETDPVITFQFLNLEHFGLTDSLYIQMNARGKMLTPYENFKARLEQEIKRLFDLEIKNRYKLNFGGNIKEVSVQKYFSHKIDTDWTNFFWQYRTKEYSLDTMILNFVKTISINYMAQEGSESFVKEFRNNERVSFNEYKNNDVLTKIFITELIEILDKFQNDNKKIESYLINFFYYNGPLTFEHSLKGKFPNYNQRILFYAYYKFLIRWEDTDGLKEWMRVVHNLTKNLEYNNETEFIRDIKGVFSLLYHSNNILEHLRENTEIKGFNKKQIKEERIKAHLFLRDKWEAIIKDAEQHNYFTGQIGFLLNFSGIETYFDKSKNCDWLENENTIFYEKFTDYKKKATLIFNGDGLNKKIPDYLWQRALLCMGDYLIKEKGNYSFLINYDRDISWKRLLFDGGTQRNKEKDLRQLRRNFVAKIFDDPLFDENNLLKSLNEIIENTEISVDDWRKPFVENVEILRYLGNKQYIRRTGYVKLEILLLKKERLSGEHVELYTYAMYLRLKNRFNILPFSVLEYSYSGGTDTFKGFYFSKWIYKKVWFELYVGFDFIEEGKFNIMLEKEKNKIDSKKLDDLILKIGEKKLKRNVEDYTRYVCYQGYYNSEKDVEKKLKNLLGKLRQLS